MAIKILLLISWIEIFWRGTNKKKFFGCFTMTSVILLYLCNIIATGWFLCDYYVYNGVSHEWYLMFDFNAALCAIFIGMGADIQVLGAYCLLFILMGSETKIEREILELEKQ